MIRPAALAQLRRWSEVIAALAMAALGLRVALMGGVILLPLGAALVALAAAYGLTAYRRIRFASGARAGGYVEVDEGQIAYFAETGGGFIGLRELTELRCITHGGRRVWRLRQEDGTALNIPIDATGAEALFDAFAALPRMDSAALLAARTAPITEMTSLRSLWRRDHP